MEEHALLVRTYGAEEPSRCGLQAPGSANPPAAVLVFFGCTPKEGPVVGAVPARVLTVPAGAKPERVAVEALLAGPNAGERQAGYVSNFGDASRGVEAQVEIRGNGLAVINFDQAIRDRARVFVSSLDARQVVATLGQFPGVERVLILIEGEPLCRALGEC
jgi:spore germination protein GerM